MTTADPASGTTDPIRRDHSTWPPLDLAFERGTLLLSGLPEGESLGIPGLKFDPRKRDAYRAEGIWYRTVVQYPRDRKIKDNDRAIGVADPVLPGFRLPVAEVFAWAERRRRGGPRQ